MGGGGRRRGAPGGPGRATSPDVLRKEGSVEMPNSPFVSPHFPQPHRAVLGSPANHNFVHEEPRGLGFQGPDFAVAGVQSIFGGRDDAESFGDTGKVDPRRPLSSVSTSAGLTPAPNTSGGSPSGSPTPLAACAAPACGAGGAGEEHHPAAQCRRPAPIQASKIFVGGVPQDMTLEEVVSALSMIGPVKKAWLQKHKVSAGSGSGSAVKNHRGFGFGVFEDPACVDRWLVGKPSRFLRLAHGGEEKQLEVKRAVSSETMNAQSQGGAPPGEPGARREGRAVPALPPLPASGRLDAVEDLNLPPAHQGLSAAAVDAALPGRQLRAVAQQTPSRWPVPPTWAAVPAAAPWAALPALTSTVPAPLPGRGGVAGGAAPDALAHPLALPGPWPHLFVDEAHRRLFEAVLKQASEGVVYED